MPIITEALTLKDLPPPPPGKTGWPWTKQTEPSPDRMSDGSEWTRISIMTPTYNYGQFLEETIRSVLLQGYPNLEYIIIDGGSMDNTVEIIKKYESWLSYWVSEPDRGQAHAINKGIARATGEILAYLNSDDCYLPGNLFKVAEYFCQFPQTDLLHGRCRYINEQGDKIGEQCGDIQTLGEILDLWDVWWKRRQFVQPEVFWTKRITEKVGFFKEELNYVMDYDYWCRILQASGVVGKIDTELACFRFTSNQKSNQRLKVAEELLKVVHPLFWSKSTNVSMHKRLDLQGKWLYNTAFISQIENSQKDGDCKMIRWLKALKVILYHPQMLFTSHLRTRINQWFLQHIQHQER